MKTRVLSVCLFVILATWLSASSQAKEAVPQDPKARKAAFVEAVVRGGGLMPWQKPGTSAEEIAFRKRIEDRKTRMLAHVRSVKHPTLLTKDQIASAKRTIAKTDWGRKWFKQQKRTADLVLAKDDAWIDQMIEELTPWQHYGFTCPRCVGKKSQEGAGGRIVGWSINTPDVIRCKACGQTYPDPNFPETATLRAPRMGQALTFFRNDRQRANDDDRSGKLAYHWCGRPIHMNFSGNVRYHKTQFMMNAARSLALVHALTGDARCAGKTVKILDRLGHCFRNWLYHDYWDSLADCDPLYAAWHDRKLKLEWKRHLSAGQYKRDTPDRAGMLQNYWGGGRFWPSTGSVSASPRICLAYDLVYDAKDADGRPLWTDAMRASVERDLLLEWILEAEPYVGGEGRADCPNNKAPRIYMAQAAIARVLGVPELADVALRGYQTVRDRSFLFDGFSNESPAYTNMYLGTLLEIPEALHGFVWPAGFKNRKGTVDLFKTDPKLRYMVYSLLDQLRPDGRYAPLSDTSQAARPNIHFFEIGLNRYPDHFRGKMPTLYAGRKPGEYALMNLDLDDLTADTGFELSDAFYPGWMTAFLRHGQGRNASMLAMPVNPPGGHRHIDNLAIFYIDRGRVVLGDQGYIGDMPQNRWIRSTHSHSLVVVGGKDQQYKKRSPKLRMMFSTPIATAVECASDAYPMCKTYRRLVIMIKGPGAETFLVDVFRVSGGKKHAFRVSSEIGASDAKGNAISLVGVDMPAEKPLPNFGGSVKAEHIYGLRDVRTAKPPRSGWQAIWKQKGQSYTLRMLSQSHRIEASNGPGQEFYRQIGRRIRYVDAINEGDGLASTFVALHEPSGPDGSSPVRRAELLATPTAAGPEAVAVKIDSKWGTYLLLSDFDNVATIDGATFKGTFGLVKIGDGKRRLIGCGASTLECGKIGFADKTPRWSGKVIRSTTSTLTSDTPAPAGFDALRDDCRNYVLIARGKCVTGYAVRSIEKNAITVERFALDKAERFDMPALRVVAE